MSDDSELATLLGEAPAGPDTGFRIGVFARVTERVRRRVAVRRAARRVGAFTLVGLVFPVLSALGVGAAEVQPVLLAAGAVGLAYVLALVTIRGPGVLMSGSRLALRVRV